MVYPVTRQTFPVQYPDTIADEDLINDMATLLVAIQDFVGLSSDGPLTETHEGRLKYLEDQTTARIVFSDAAPTGTPILNDIWINTSLDPWVQYYFNGSVWTVIGANAVMLSGKMVDTAIEPTDQQVPVYNAATAKIEWGTVLVNIFTAPGQMIVSRGEEATPDILLPEAGNDVLFINPTTLEPQWGPTPKTFNQLYLNQYMDFVEDSTPPPVSASGELRIYADASQHKLYYSANGATYAALGSSGGSDLSALLNTKGAMVFASDALGTLASLNVGPEGSVLVSVGGIPMWRSNAFVERPVSAVNGSTLYFDGTYWLYLAPGVSNQFLKSQGPNTPPIWSDLPVSPPGSGIISPVGSTTGDILVHDATDWTRLGAGTSGHFLQTNGLSGPPSWVALPPTLSNPMSGVGDMIYGTIGGAPARLIGGTVNNDRVLSIVGGSPAWVDPPSSMGRQFFMSG